MWSRFVSWLKRVFKSTDELSGLSDSEVERLEELEAGTAEANHYVILDGVPAEGTFVRTDSPEGLVVTSSDTFVVASQLTENFMVEEFACKDGTAVPFELYDNVSELANNLQVLRDELGKPIKIMSGYRSPEYNIRIGGARKSQHMQAKAADIRVKGIGPARLADKIEQLIAEGKMKKGGVGRYPTFTHYDVRGRNARWNGTRKKN